MLYIFVTMALVAVVFASSLYYLGLKRRKELIEWVHERLNSDKLLLALYEHRVAGVICVILTHSSSLHNDQFYCYPLRTSRPDLNVLGGFWANVNELVFKRD